MEANKLLKPLSFLDLNIERSNGIPLHDALKESHYYTLIESAYSIQKDFCFYEFSKVDSMSFLKDITISLTEWVKYLTNETKLLEYTNNPKYEYIKVEKEISPWIKLVYDKNKNFIEEKELTKELTPKTSAANHSRIWDISSSRFATKKESKWKSWYYRYSGRLPIQEAHNLYLKNQKNPRPLIDILKDYDRFR